MELIWRMTNGEGVPLPSLPMETAASATLHTAVPIHRALQELEDEGFLTVEALGSGKAPTSYRKTGLETED